MLPTTILPQCLPDVFSTMHQSTVPVVLRAVDAIGTGGWLTLTAIARRWPGAERVAAPMKAADRLLRSPVLSASHELIYGAMARWLVREKRSLIAVDWSDLKANGDFKLLRAGLAVQGRTVTLWEEVHPQRTAGSASVERQFLRTLQRLLPEGCQPIVITDAGFRRPWFRDVVDLGWDYIGRVRGTLKVKPHASPTCAWQSMADVRANARSSGSHEAGDYDLGRHHPVMARLVIHAAKPKGRHATNVHGKRRCDKASNKAARAARESWVLATSLEATDVDANAIARCYARRMTIELSFRDLKSSAFGAGFEHSLTRKGQRLGNLLVLFALSQFAAWLLGLCDQWRGNTHRLAHCAHPKRRQYSIWRTGMEMLKRPLWWPPPSTFRRFVREISRRCPEALSTGGWA